MLSSYRGELPEASLIVSKKWGPFGFAQGRLFDSVAVSLRETATPLRMTIVCGVLTLPPQLLLQLFLDRRSHFRRIGGDLRLETLHHVAIAIHQELGKVPLDVAIDAGRRVFGQVLIERRLVVALDRDFA